MRSQFPLQADGGFWFQHNQRKHDCGGDWEAVRRAVLLLPDVECRQRQQRLCAPREPEWHELRAPDGLPERPTNGDQFFLPRRVYAGLPDASAGPEETPLAVLR